MRRLTDFTKFSVCNSYPRSELNLFKWCSLRYLRLHDSHHFHLTIPLLYLTQHAQSNFTVLRSSFLQVSTLVLWPKTWAISFPLSQFYLDLFLGFATCQKYLSVSETNLAEPPLLVFQEILSSWFLKARCALEIKLSFSSYHCTWKDCKTFYCRFRSWSSILHLLIFYSTSPFQC